MNDCPYGDGWKAFENGVERSDYPYYEDYSDECSWVDGWDDALRASVSPVQGDE